MNMARMQTTTLNCLLMFILVGVIYTQSDLTAHYRTSCGSGYNLHKEEN